MSEALHTAILEVPEKQWKGYGEPDPEVDRECAEVVFVPSERSEHKDSKPLRYVAIRCANDKEGCLPTAVVFDASRCSVTCGIGIR